MSDEEKLRQQIYHGFRVLTAAIVTGSIATAKPKSKPDEIVEKALEIADQLLERLEAKALIGALVQDPPKDGKVSAFVISED
jgi:hypothetical protein